MVGAGSPKSPEVTPPALSTGPFERSSHSHYRIQEMPEGWEDDDMSQYYADQAPPYAGTHEVLQDQYSPPARVHDQGVYQRQPFPHSLSSPHILSPPASPQQMRVALPPRRRVSGIGGDVQRAGAGLGLTMSASMGSTSTLGTTTKRVVSSAAQTLYERDGMGQTHDMMHRTGSRRPHTRTRQPTTLHPYVCVRSHYCRVWFTEYTFYAGHDIYFSDR